MKEIVYDSCRAIEVDYFDEALKIVEGLVMSDYEVTVRPVFETTEELRKRSSFGRVRARKHFVIEIGEKFNSKVEDLKDEN